VPHAGYPYSGPVAAAAFRRLKGHRYDGVIVIGFTHRLPFEGSSVDTREAYQTPLGLLPIDREAAAALQTHPGVGHIEAAHGSGEHSVEVELPFLQVALENPKVVPVLMGSAGAEDARQLADALAALARTGEYLFVFSTDLSHYHPYEEARRRDEATVGAMLSETPQAVARLFRAGRMEACGQGPILASLFLSARLGHLKPELIRSANSGDTAGDRSRVVGYAAIAMHDRLGPPGERLSAESGAVLVRAARAVLDSHFAGEQPKLFSQEERAQLSQEQGLFVTLRTQGRLRGCIGRIESDQPLAAILPQVALDAALRDPRFPPVTAEELGALEIEVSVLTKPERLAGLEELVPGRDGVILSHDGHQGVFLPQVWDETGWTRVEFLRELASQKAELPPDAWQRAALFTFQDQVFTERN